MVIYAPPEVVYAPPTVGLEMDDANEMSNHQRRRLSVSSRVSGKDSPLMPGTPLLNTRRNSKSLQDIKRLSPTKQSMAKPSRKFSLAGSEKSLVSIHTMGPHKSTMITRVPSSAPTIITVDQTDSEDEAS